MHQSVFNYSITRPYPYRWFTPVAIVGAIVLVVLLSVMNFVQNSYVLQVEYADNPNATIANGSWFSHWPSYLTRSVRPTCEPTNIDVNSQIFTNQSGLTWTLTSVSKHGQDSQPSPSLPYMNNRLDSCFIPEIQMDFDGTRDRETAVLQSTPWDVQVRAFVTCGLWSPMGFATINLTALYDPIQPYTVAGSSVFVATDVSSRASMWWAEALLSAYWVEVANRINQVAYNIHPQLAKGLAVLYPNQLGEHDITSLDFFDVQFNFINLEEQYGLSSHGTRATIGKYLSEYHPGFKDDLVPQPRIWRQVDSLAKSMFSAALTDLGQTTSGPQSNIVANASTLQLFSSNFSTISESSLLYYNQVDLRSYDDRQSREEPMGPLGVTPSVIATKYLCQVPQRRPLGDIFISVLLADLVLLQAAWKLYTLLVDQVMTRRRSSAKHCEGCLEAEGENERMIRETVAREAVLALRCIKGGVVTTTAALTGKGDIFDQHARRSHGA